MNTYILSDFLNLGFRAKHVVQNSDINMKIGLAMHTMFNSVRYVNKKFNGNHLVVCLEGSSWRKKVYTQYKRHIAVAQASKPMHEQEDDMLFIESLTEMSTYLNDKTNATVLQCPVEIGRAHV